MIHIILIKPVVNSFHYRFLVGAPCMAFNLVVRVHYGGGKEAIIDTIDTETSRFIVVKLFVLQKKD